MIKDVRMIRERMRHAQGHQKSYLNKRKRDLEFDMGDKVFIKVAPYKYVMRFNRKDKLMPRFMGPFEVLKPISKVTY